VFSGEEIVRIMESAGFFRARQKGSHLIMQRRTDHGTITVPVPLHPSVKIGTCNPSFANLALRANVF
jgi:predicted RNA binding protein YcfA (HicA-like mRNA interferase family)